MRGRYILLLAALFSCISCLTEQETSTSPQAAITTFTIGYYNVRFHDINVKGDEVVVNVRENGSMYPMTIDQINNRIYNADSMAYGSDLSKVTSSVYGTGTVGYRYLDDPDYYYVWSSHDSIDFTRKLQFVIMSTDGTYGRTYDVQINIRKVFPDSLLWAGPDTTGFPILSGISAAVRNDSVFCFGTDTTDIPSVTVSNTDGSAWNGINGISGITADGWSHRVTVYNGKFYTVCGGTLYGSSDALNWSSVRSGIRSIVVSAFDEGPLWAVSQDGNIIKSEDMSEWTVVQSIPEGFPDSSAVVYTYPLATNAQLSRSVLVGVTNDTLYASVWTMLTGDTVWTEVDRPAKTDLCLPAAYNMSVIEYDGALFGLGLGIDGFRQSNDNGVTWYRCDSYAEDYSSWNRYMQLPEAINDCESGYVAVTDSKGYIWIMTEDGRCWRGSINRLRKD